MLSFEFLRVSLQEWQQLFGFFLQQLGQSGEFLFDDQHDDTVANEQFGVGDGKTTQFQLGRHFYDSSGNKLIGDFPYAGPQPQGFAFEYIFAPKAAPTIQVNAGTVTNYTIGATGLVTFSTPPANGAALTWTGGFWFRCRFTEDTSDFDKLFSNTWSNQKVEFISCKV